MPDLRVEAFERVQAGADGRAALGQVVQTRQTPLNALDAKAHLLGIPAEYLAECDRSGVLHVSAASLDDVLELNRFGRERLVKLLHGWQQASVDFDCGGNVHATWKGIIARLASVDVIVWMHGLFGSHFTSQHFDCTIRDYLVHVHIGLRTTTRLPDHQREVIIQFTRTNLLANGNNGVANLRVQIITIDIY